METGTGVSTRKTKGKESVFHSVRSLSLQGVGCIISILITCLHPRLYMVICMYLLAHCTPKKIVSFKIKKKKENSPWLFHNLRDYTVTIFGNFL